MPAPTEPGTSVSYTRIKICGITSPADAVAVAEAGADAIGLVFHPPSPRAVTVEQAREIARALPPLVQVLALFVDEPAAVIRRTLDVVPVHTLQFHGEEPADFCRQFARPYIKAVRVRGDMDLAAACAPYDSAAGWLLDSWQEGVPGGTGRAFDWQLARQDFRRPLVLAGGLNADNVGEGIRLLRPAAVDVSGGVEAAPGRKDHAAIREFVQRVRETDLQLSGEHNDQ